MSDLHAAFALVALGLLAYLVFAMLKPERLS